MINFTQGNLLEAEVEAVVNTVNTVGVMGKGIALMFRERFPANFDAYARACKDDEVRIGKMFVTENEEFFTPRWIINFPTKTHWRAKTEIQWIEKGLADLVKMIRDKGIHSVAIPPLGSGNGGLDWRDVRPLIVSAFNEMQDVHVIIYEPTPEYQNVAKPTGVEKLTPARALVAEMVRRYCLLGIDCSILEVQKLAWFIERGVQRYRMRERFNFRFRANRYGPYSQNLMRLLDSLDGSYLRCEKRLADADPLDLIWFNEKKYERVQTYLTSGPGKDFSQVLEWASTAIIGFESPLGMELLATVDWMMHEDNIEPSVEGVMEGLAHWTGGNASSRRKLAIFNDRLVSIALTKLQVVNRIPV